MALIDVGYQGGLVVVHAIALSYRAWIPGKGGRHQAGPALQAKEKKGEGRARKERG